MHGKMDRAPRAKNAWVLERASREPMISLTDSRGRIRPLQHLVQEIFLKALAHTGQNTTKAADGLRIHKRTLERLRTKLRQKK